jgi:hypothetical protein
VRTVNKMGTTCCWFFYQDIGQSHSKAALRIEGQQYVLKPNESFVVQHTWFTGYTDFSVRTFFVVSIPPG